MPKQLYKIDQFHGGLNSNSDPRDIADNEFSSAKDVVFNELGRIRTMGGVAAHGDMNSTIIGHVEPGYGLYQISHDREYAELGEHLKNTNTFDEGWTRTNDFAADASDITYTHDTGGGTVYQAYGNRLHIGVNSSTYVFRYTMSNLNTPANVTSLKILTSSGFSSADIDLPVSNETHQVQFTSASDAVSQSFKLTCVSSGTVTFNLDDLSLHLIDNAETEDDYMLVSDTDATAGVGMYSKGRDATTYSRLTYGSIASGKPIFYNVDGVLRVCDSSFNNASNRWFGYVKDNLFQSCAGDHFIHKRFYEANQAILPPNESYFDEAILTLGQAYAETTATTYSFVDASDQDRFTNQDGVFHSDDGVDTGQTVTNIGKIVVIVTATDTSSNHSAQGEIRYVLKVGPSTASTFTDLAKDTDYSISGDGYGDVFTREHTFTWDMNSNEFPIAEDETANGVRAKLQSIYTGSGVSGLIISSVKCYEATYTSASHALLTDNMAIVEFNAGSPSSGTASGWDYEWNVGLSFVYDDLGVHRQESLIKELVDEDANADKIMTIGTSTHSPQIRLCLKYSHVWNPRVVGINLYMKRVSKTTNEPWYLQAKYDLIQGKGQRMPSGNEVDFTFDPSVDEFQCFFEREDLLTPNLGDTYTSETGVTEDEKSLFSQYRTAVVANRRTYIGGLKVNYTDLSQAARNIMGDTIIKSPVNRFDTFPLSNKIEAAVRDGDAIVALAEYADRLLEFKKRSLYIINISKDAEYLEDSHMHKGVLHPGAVTKTDYGIAWVNKFGCYFYDGQKVSDLIEKGPKQIISASDWNSFVTNNTIVGYVPLNKQLVVLKDSSSTSVGDIYLYDMVTQSWSIGDSKFTDSKNRTNFVSDWDGNLVLSYESSSNTITTQKWSDTALSSSNFELTTKDIDFGQPSLRKKVYKLYVTYTGGTSGPQPEKTKVVCVADSSNSLDEKYFDMYTAAGKTLIWFDVPGGSSVVSGTGSYADTIEVTQVGTGDSAERVAVALASAINEDAGGHTTAEVDGNTVIITDGANATRTNASEGDTGFTISTIQEGTGSTVSQNVDVTYAVDGSSSYSQFDANLDSSSTTQTELSLKPNASINNIKSIKIKFSGTAASTFQINDLSIVYRLKSVI